MTRVSAVTPIAAALRLPVDRMSLPGGSPLPSRRGAFRRLPDPILPHPAMRRTLLVPTMLALALAAHPAAAQYATGGFLVAGPGGGGTESMDARFSIEGGYTLEIANRHGPYFGARYTFGMHRLRADERALRERYGAGAGAVEGGGGTLYDTGGDVEAGYGAGVLRVYGFAGIHYYRQYQEPLTIRLADDGEEEVITRARYELGPAYGAGVHLRLTDTGALVAEWYRGGGGDVMRLSGTRFGLRWAW